MPIICPFSGDLVKWKLPWKLSNSGLEHESLRYDFKSLNWNRIYCSVSQSDMKSKLGDRFLNLFHGVPILQIC